MEEPLQKAKEIEVSHFENFKYVKDASFEKIIESIKNGHWEKDISTYRHAKEKGDNDADSLKKKLPGFTPSATFKSKRLKEHINQYTQIVVLDLDKLPVDLVEQMRGGINSDQYTFASFVSPSGNGIKFFIRVDSDMENHDYAYSEVADYFENLLNIDIDKSGKDMTRLCFISADQSAYISHEANVFKIERRSTGEPGRRILETMAIADPIPTRNSDKQFEDVVKLTLQKMRFATGTRNNFVRLLSGSCNRWGISIDEAHRLILGSEFCYDFNEVSRTIESAYSKTEDFNKFPLRNPTQHSPEESETLPDSRLATSPVIESQSPFIPDFVYRNLPAILAKGVSPIEGQRKRDMFITGALGVLSGCFPHFSGVYHQRIVNSNLYVFVSAPPGSGKSVLEFAKFYASKFHDFILETPVGLDDAKPLLLIPGNSSDAIVIGHLKSTGGIGIFFETEADALTANFGKEWGDFSVLLRLAYHHETYQYSRKGNNEYIIISKPKLSVILSGTPGQIGSLTKSVEDGLFSRISFYRFDGDTVWEDPSPKEGDKSLEPFFTELGNETYLIIQAFYRKQVTFGFTRNQWNKFNIEQRDVLGKAKSIYGRGIAGIITRSGLMWYRIAMTLTAISYSAEIQEGLYIECSDINFEVAAQLIKVYRLHTLAVYSTLPKPPINEHDANILNFFNALPKGEFKRDAAVEIGAKFELNPNMVSKALSQLIQRNKLKDSKKYSFYIK